MTAEGLRGCVLVDCHACNGTGIDDGDWSGRCSRCAGTGAVVDDGDERAEDDADD